MSFPPTAGQSLGILDIDGVLADVRHRLHYLAGRPKDWDGFFAAADRDDLLAAGAELAHRLAAKHEVLYLTGRPERIRDVTGRWLVRHRVPRGRLLMRPDSDRRPARMFKAEVVRLLAGHAPIGLVVDDDPEVIDLLRRDGHPVQLADWLPYTEPLAEAQQRDGRN